MENMDFAKMQQDWLKRMSGSSTAYSDAWAGAFRDGSFERFFDTYQRFMRNQAGRPSLQRAGMSAAMNGFFDIVGAAVEDLPLLMRQARDTAERRRVADRWAKSCERFLRESLGLPSSSDADPLARTWNQLTQLSPSPASALQGRSPWDQFGWPEIVPDASLPPITREWRRFWQEAFRKTLESFSQFGMGTGREDRLVKRHQELMEAQAKSIESMRVLNEQVSKAAAELGERLVQSVPNEEISKLSSDSYISFFKAWLTQWEKTLKRLTESETFLKSAEETWRLGTDFLKVRESWASEWRTLLDVPGRDDLEKAVRAMEMMQARIESLEDQVRELKARVEESANSA